MKNKIFLAFLISILFFSISTLQASFSIEEQEFLKEINRFNVKTIIEKHLKENPDLLNSSKDKDIVVFLGKTGSGKSTLINYISDKDLRIENGCIVLQNPLNPASMKIGSGANSKTFLPKFLKSGDFLFYNLPSFNDIRGAAISLINACFIKNIIENAKTARLVFVTGQDELTADRGKLFKQLSNIIRNLIPNESIEDFSALAVTKSTIGSNKQQLTNYLKTQVDAGTLDCWIDRDKLTRMSFPFNNEINQNDKANILEVIRNINPRKIDFVNISAIYNNREQNKIKNIYAEEIEDNFNMLLNNNINTLFSLDIISLENKKNYFTHIFFNDLVSSLNKSDLITLLRPLSEDIYTSCWNEAKQNQQIKIQDILEQIRKSKAEEEAKTAAEAKATAKQLEKLWFQIEQINPLGYSHIFSNKDYRIVCTYNNRALNCGAPQTNEVIGARVEAYNDDLDLHPHRLWKLVSTSANGFYRIVCTYNNRALNCGAPQTNEVVGAGVETYNDDLDLHPHRLWKLVPTSMNGFYRIVCKYNNRALNCGAPQTNEVVGARVEAYNDDYDLHPHRLWKFIPSN